MTCPTYAGGATNMWGRWASLPNMWGRGALPADMCGAGKAKADPHTAGCMPDPAAPSPSPAPQAHGALDAPSPEVVPQFLRRRQASLSTTGRTPAVPVDATLIEAITRIVTAMMEVHVRESVTAAVRALAP